MPEIRPTAGLEAPPAALHARAAMITRDMVSGDAATFVPTSLDVEKRTVDVVWSTGARVTRHEVDWNTWAVRKFYEELDLRGARLDRLNGGAPLLIEHSTRDGWDGRPLDGAIGVVLRASVIGTEGIATIQFDETERAIEIFGRVQRGMLRSISVGYQVAKWDRSKTDEDGTQIRRAIDWEPYELSIVAIPADAGAQIRSMAEAAPLLRNRATPAISEVPMTTPTPTAGNEPAPSQTRTNPEPAPVALPPASSPADDHTWRASDMEKLHQRGLAFGLDAAAVFKVMGEHRSLDAATDALQEMAVKRNAPRQAPHVQVITDEGDTRRAAVENALAARANPQVTKLTDAGREYRGMTLLELGRSYVEDTHGVRLRNLSKRELANVLLGLERSAGMHSTSDFKNLLANVVSKRLRDTYSSAPSLWRMISRQSNAPDFKEKAVLQLAGMPELKKVREGAEYTYASLSDSVEKYSIATYGRIIAITRQTLINDDLGAFDRLPSLFGRAAAELENDLVWGILMNNPTMADGTALFHASRGNIAGSGAAPSEATFEAAETALGDQKDAADKPLNLRFRYFAGPQKYSVAVRKLLTSVTATKSGDVNVYQNAVEPIIENRLKPATGAAPWFMIVDPAQWDTIEYAYLEGEEGLYTEERVGFEVDGLEIKARLDFGAAPIDGRGMFMNPGI